MRSLRAELMDQELRRLLLHLVGSSRGWVIWVTVATLTSLGWFADGLFGIVEGSLRHWLQGSPPVDWRIGLLLALPLILLLGTLVFLSRRARERLAFRARRETRPRAVEGLILFLSPRRDEDSASIHAVRGELESVDTRASVTGPWRMPLEALAFHVFGGGGPLREVVLVDSAGPKGSHSQIAEFRDLLDRLWPGRQGDVYAGLDGPVRIRTAGEVLADLEGGVDVFDLEPLVQAVDRLFRRLVNEGLPRDRIVIDLTGGPKLASVAGTAVALAEGRRFQYADTHTLQVGIYDPSYEPSESGDLP